jgi:hypothetical protein
MRFRYVIDATAGAITIRADALAAAAAGGQAKLRDA